MPKRNRVPPSVEADVLMASRRRCCVCVFLLDRHEVRTGQIAHLNGNRTQSTFENLVWLCLEHHDALDSRTSQSKGLMSEEVRRHRDALYERYGWVGSTERKTNDAPAVAKQKSRVIRSERHPLDTMMFTRRAWRPLWLEHGEPILFAYKASNRADGICLIERIDLPDRRVVIAAIQVAGNPGRSITNCVEELCQQVCDKFQIPPAQLVWLEHYDESEYASQWSLVRFGRVPPHGTFAYPTWEPVTQAIWRELKLRPKKRLIRRQWQFQSKLKKLFAPPTWNLGPF